MRKLFFAVVVLLIGAIFTSSVHAGSLDIHTEQIDPGSVLPNHVVNRVLVEFTDTATTPSFRGQQMMVKLTEGSIYDDSKGSAIPPPQSFVNVFPSLAYDTFVAMCGDRAETSYPLIVLSMGLPNDPFPMFPPLPSPIPPFDETEFSVAWAAGTGVNVPPMAEPCLTAQVTLSDNAQGMWSYFSSTADGTTRVYNNLRIENGVMLLVPEPTTVALAGVAMLGVLAGAHRNRR